ncbi:DUF3231 family protein [Paenibacillus cremeus]|uniref:DUF3231 family protein n=1 Tax=Paenibacillus cremeus TaxID=2163881 RepID=A0A559K4X8_9BACL|nr:DUF3231 family protein [Paenibacillus cremeus]TVY07133.1 DUF3231 family protein [Paenibacillus cremeus]
MTKKPRLSSAEMASLWSNCVFISIVHHMLQYFLSNIEDQEIKSYVEYTHSLSGKHLHRFQSAFKEENIPAPRGINSDDIFPGGHRLYSDTFYVNYIAGMAKFALITYAVSSAEASRTDIQQMYNEIVNDLQIINQKSTQFMLSKGIYIHSPYVPAPKEADVVKKQSFLAGFFGNKRPLTVFEINQLFNNIQSNANGKALMMGFSQVTQNKGLREYFIRGKELSNKYVSELSDALNKEDVAIPPTFDGEVTDCTEPPFSERLMLFHVALLGSSGLGNYGISLAACTRRDLAAMFGRIMLEAKTYIEDGWNLMIEEGWMEQPPLAADREALVT